MDGSSVRGRFLWHELLTSDPDGAKEFYTRVVGWQTQAWEAEGVEEPYTVWVAGETPAGGVMRLPEEARQQGAPPHWLTYVGTTDVDATAAQAERLGARVLVPPTSIPSVGRFSVAQDPQGAVFAMYTPESEPPVAASLPRPGEYSWHELSTTDHEAAFGFYAELFGWEKSEAMDMGEMGVYQMYGLGGQMLGGMYNKPAEVPGPPYWLPYAHVADVHAATEVVKAQGGTVLHGPMEVPGGDWIVQAMDPQGAVFALHARARAASAV